MKTAFTMVAPPENSLELYIDASLKIGHISSYYQSANMGNTHTLT